MTAIVNTVFFIYIIVCGVGIFIGLDLKKWYSWLFGLYGFVTGLLFGLSKSPDVTGGLVIGAIFASIVLYGGATSYWQRQRFK